ncbi:MAG: hypothetical protein ACXWQ5_00885 [Ktedonobacterales bacterium]
MKTLDTAQEKLREARKLFFGKFSVAGLACLTLSLAAAWLLVSGWSPLLAAPDVILSVVAYVFMAKFSRQMDRLHKEALALMAQDRAEMEEYAKRNETPQSPEEYSETV